jgi:hypothetical protein
MKTTKRILHIAIVFILMASFISCEKDVNPRNIEYSIKGLSSEYKVTYVKNGESFSEVLNGSNFFLSFPAEKGEVLYFDIKFKDQVHKMSNFGAFIRVNKTILREAYSYDMKWADSATQDIPYPYEIILRGTVPF